MALGGLDLRATSLSWHDLDLVRRRQAPMPAADVGLLMCDLDNVARVERARAVISSVALPWLVLTSALRGPGWGAVLDVGAGVVRGSTTSLEELRSLLHLTVTGTRDPTGPEHADLIGQWSELARERTETLARLATLSPRERQVLGLLYRGEAVSSIADLLGVAPSTVRTQVKSLLRKLGVSSQLAAVAAYGHMRSVTRTSVR